MSSGNVAATDRQQPSSRAATRWLVAVVGVVLFEAVIPVLFFHRFYFTGDTQNAYYPWWHQLGVDLRHGHWPIFDAQSWRGGNYIAEGQWGLFSPLIGVIALGATVVQNAAVYTFVVKTVLSVFGGIGVYLLARSYRLAPPLAFVVATLVPLAGGVGYLDWPSWAAAQMGTCLLPWAWWGLRRVMYDAAGGWLVLIVGYLLVSIGYVYPTLYLGVVFAGCLVEAWLCHRRTTIPRIVLLGVACLLVALTVYLPGMLTASVTLRNNTEVIPIARLQGDIGGLVTGMVPIQDPVIFYIAWFLPMLMWVDRRRLREHARGLSGLVVMVVVMTIWILGPNQIGPIRMPMRTISVYSLIVILTLVIALARGLPGRPSKPRLMLTLALVALAVWSRLPERWGDGIWGATSGVLVLLGLVLMAKLLSRRVDGSHLIPLAVVAITVGLGIDLVQHHVEPLPGAVDRGSPAHLSGYRHQLSAARGDAILVGSPEPLASADHHVASDVLIAGAWYLNPHPMASTESVIGFRAYSDRYCMHYNGSTCAKALGRLFEVEPATGRRWVDLMSLSTVAIVKGDGQQSWRTMTHPPSGWHVAQEQRDVVTWVRDQPLPTAGGVTWTSSGVAVDQVSYDDRGVRFRLKSVPSAGGSAVLSRLAWPGYRIEGASFASPVHDTLLRVKLTPEDVGKTVTVRFSPPGWTFEVVCWWLGVVGGVVVCVTGSVRRRRRRHTVAPEQEAPALE